FWDQSRRTCGSIRRDLRSISASVRSPSGYGGRDQSQDDGDGAGNSDDDGVAGPFGLVLGGLRRLPFYAQIVLLCVLWVFAGIGINVGTWRFGHGRYWQGLWCLAS